MITVKLKNVYNEIKLFFPNYKMASTFVMDYAENLE